MQYHTRVYSICTSIFIYDNINLNSVKDILRVRNADKFIFQKCSILG